MAIFTVNEKERTVKVDGTIDNDATFEAILHALTKTKDPITIDMSQLESLSNEGFRALNTTSKELGGWVRITIKGIHGKVKEKADIMGISNLFQTIA